DDLVTGVQTCALPIYKDGIPDLVTAGTAIGGGGVLVFLGNGTGHFSAGTRYKTGAQGINGIVVDSFNTDSNPDIAISNRTDDDRSEERRVGKECRSRK